LLVIAAARGPIWMTWNDSVCGPSTQQQRCMSSATKPQ
jgi:hypothetical protein